MNGNNNDTNYRYVISEFQITIGGKGNGIYTKFNNIDEISKQINHPSEIILKYIAFVTGSNYTSSTNTITGNHTPDTLKTILLQYIKYFVLCPVCNIPETIPHIINNKKNISLYLTCSACNSESQLLGINKNQNKGIEFISKYLNTNPWTSNNNVITIINNDDKDDKDDLNPF